MRGTSVTNLASYIDHTLLKPEATEADIKKICAEAKQFQFKAVCVNSGYVELAARELKGSSCLVASVVGFPIGAELSEAKVRETELVIAAGAKEIDMVIRIGAIKERNYSLAEKDIRAVVQAAGGAVVKVILETGLLTLDEIREASKISEQAGAHFVKTATGFLGRGASLEDIAIMKSAISAKMKIKASGGIKTQEQALAMIAAGAHRLGTSSGVALVQGQQAQGGY
jgi:deoxyribose-phosphate aldolase